MILVIDNYDSFTYNLVQYIGELGAETVVYRNDELTVEQAIGLVPEKIVISPGPGTPHDAGISVPLINAAKGRIPLFGVCLGHQAIGEALGGNVIRAEKLMHGKVSMVHHDGHGVFRGLENPFPATRYHSLVVEQESLPSSLTVRAWTEDGVIMGMDAPGLGFYGVQFHPESIMTSEGHKLIRNFLEI
ncbi:MAG: aminodeoxychorismate/anthranilate synthase component II [Chlorobiaceae bacterium]|nr:aminodeoxychorismate/anthranilate synthase component II [Chlorobiaceae bacterium]